MSSIRVLVVDDSEDDTLLLMDELRSNDLDPTYLRVDTSDAMETALADQTWEIIIADYTMPDFSGPEALRVLQESGQDIPLILVSGTTEEHVGIDMMRAGAQDFIYKRSLARLAPAVFRELHEAENRRQRLQAEQGLREAEAHKLEFYRRTILAATDGKLFLCEPDEIERMDGAPVGSWVISGNEDLGSMRDEVISMARQEGMEERRIPDLLSCIIEAATNAVKHAGGGRAALFRTSTGLFYVVSDSGPGIGALSLPDVALSKGYSTAGTLGMGYKVMIASADRVCLATGPAGTVLGCEVGFCSTPECEVLLEKMPGWEDSNGA